MTNHISKNQAYNVSDGTIIHGKWHGHNYKVVKQLGYGAQGTVYLAKDSDKLVALKIGRDSASLTTEVNVLRQFAKVQGDTLGPCLYDVDDWVTNIGTLPFYSMEYIEGDSLIEMIKDKGFEWGIIFIIQLLGDLDKLHREGWVFGDLKPDNLIITKDRRRIRWLDVGGTTRIGRSIKEYTEFFDRGYWGFGTRKAEPSYDMFAVVMTLINIAYQSRFDKNAQPKEQLVKLIQNNSNLRPYQDILKAALQGNYNKAQEMRDALLMKLNETPDRDIRKSNKKVKVKVSAKPQSKQQTRSITSKPKSHPTTKTNQNQTINHRQQRRKSKKSEWRQTLFLAIGIMIAYVIYITVYVM